AQLVGHYSEGERFSAFDANAIEKKGDGQIFHLHAGMSIVGVSENGRFVEPYMTSFEPHCAQLRVGQVYLIVDTFCTPLVRLTLSEPRSSSRANGLREIDAEIIPELDLQVCLD